MAKCSCPIKFLMCRLRISFFSEIAYVKGDISKKEDLENLEFLFEKSKDKKRLISAKESQ